MKQTGVLVIFAGFGILAFGVLFLLAAAADASYWLLTILMLATGGGAIWGGSNMVKDSDKPDSWLPLDEFFNSPFAWLLIVAGVVMAVSVLFQMMTKSAVLFVILAAILLFTSFLINVVDINRTLNDTTKVMRMSPEFRLVIRKAYKVRQQIQRIVGGLKKGKREYFTKYLDDIEQTIALIFTLAAGASNFAGFGQAEKVWKQKLVKADRMLDLLASKIASVTSLSSMSALDDDFAKVKDALALAEDHKAGIKEVSGRE